MTLLSANAPAKVPQCHPRASALQQVPGQPKPVLVLTRLLDCLVTRRRSTQATPAVVLSGPDGGAIDALVRAFAADYGGELIVLENLPLDPRSRYARDWSEERCEQHLSAGREQIKTAFARSTGEVAEGPAPAIAREGWTSYGSRVIHLPCVLYLRAVGHGWGEEIIEELEKARRFPHVVVIVTTGGVPVIPTSPSEIYRSFKTPDGLPPREGASLDNGGLISQSREEFEREHVQKLHRRFGPHIHVPMPDEAARCAVLKWALRGVAVDGDACEQASRLLTGYTYHDMEGIAHKALRLVVGSREDTSVSSSHLEEAMKFTRRSVPEINLRKWEIHGQTGHELSMEYKSFLSEEPVLHPLPPDSAAWKQGADATAAQRGADDDDDLYN